MKVTLEFNLPEETGAFNDALAGRKAIRILQEVTEELRRILKYEDNPENLRDKVDEIRKSIYEEFPDLDER